MFFANVDKKHPTYSKREKDREKVKKIVYIYMYMSIYINRLNTYATLNF